jgi:NhaP-type Na+/H+ or K+/H+ antiporter
VETAVLAFGVLLIVAVLFSERAQRTVLSASVLFLVAGFAVGGGGLGWMKISQQPHVVGTFAELALFAILFVDGAQLPLAEIRHAWRLPGRALLVGMPLTIAGIALGARLLLDLTWTEAFLVGAILSPTDPVFVAAILEHEAVPLRLRRLLSVESGVNDGLALPAVMVLLAVAGHRAPHPLRVLADAGGGIVIGVLVPAAFLWLEGRRFFAASEGYRPLAGLAIAAVLLGLAKSLGLNEFLAAFAAGITLASWGPDFAGAVRSVGAPLAEALKLATLLVFGAMLTIPALLSPGWSGLLFVLVALLAARPLALVLAFIGRPLSTKEWLAAGWFGPKGFASLLYALILGQAGLPAGDRLFDAIALVIVISIVAHSSSDVAVARVFRVEEREPHT